MSCSVELRNAGKAYPRTCVDCGLGPCSRIQKIELHPEQGIVAKMLLPPAPPRPAVQRHYCLIQDWDDGDPKIISYFFGSEPALGTIYQSKGRAFKAVRVDNRALNAGYVHVEELIWFKWDGSYEKQAYDVWVKGCDIVLACWPNAGFMNAQDGTGRKWAPDEVLAVRVSEYQGRYPKPF